MSYAPFNDFLLRVARGLVPGHTGVLIRGHTPTQAVLSGAFHDIWEAGSGVDLVHLAAAETMNIVSTSASDDGSPAGVGAQTVLVQGVDGTGAAIQEVVVLNGITNVLTSLSYLRVNSLVVTAAGTTGWNVGIITATASTAATVQCRMNAVQSISHNSQYTVPLGKTLFIMQSEFNVAKDGGGGLPVADFQGVAVQGGLAAGGAWVQFFEHKVDASVANSYILIVSIPSPQGGLIARTDIKLLMATDTVATEVRTRLYGILIDD